MAVVPGLQVTVDRAAFDAAPLRTDIVGFVGQAQRGPLDVAVPIRGWREFEATFGAGGLLAQAVRAYFANGGNLAYVVRVGRHEWPIGSAQLAGAEGQWPLWVEATSVGTWSGGARIELSVKRATGRQLTSWVRVHLAGEVDSEEAIALDAAGREWTVAGGRFRLVSEEPLGAAFDTLLDRRAETMAAALIDLHDNLETTCDDPDPSAELGDYRRAGSALLRQPDVSMMALPDAAEKLTNEDDWIALHVEVVEGAESTLDRLVLVDLPDSPADAGLQAAVTRVERLRGELRPSAARAAALYHPWLMMEDRRAPTGRGRRRRASLAHVPPSGYVAGLASRLDRVAGPARAPANAYLEDAADLTVPPSPEDDEALRSAGVNPLRYVPGRGLQVWGARTLAQEPEACFVANRRVVHRLVRAMRQASEPLVFESNAEPLWLALTRALTMVLVEAWRAGALRGSTPAEAFSVRCDATTANVELGLIAAEVEFVPARTMERITLRVLLGAEGNLEVIEQ